MAKIPLDDLRWLEVGDRPWFGEKGRAAALTAERERRRAKIRRERRREAGHAALREGGGR